MANLTFYFNPIIENKDVFFYILALITALKGGKNYILM